MNIFLNDFQATEKFGGELWKILPKKHLIFLRGDLGMGKTTLVRGFLRAAGFQGTVKSPTYNLVEEYDIAGQKIFHFDLYRLTEPEELEWIGIDDYLNQNSICFIEWAEKGVGILPSPDKIITLSVHDEGRFVKID